MSFLRRLLGGERGEADEGGASGTPRPTSEELLEDEREHELEVMRDEAARLDDLQQRQLRYADRAWTPPAQGGEKRADDEDTDEEA